MKTSKIKRTISHTAVVIILFFFFGVSGYMAASFIPGQDRPSSVLFRLMFFELMLFVLYFVHIIIHEAGHMVFGLLTGYQFSSFRILNISLQKDSDGKLRFHRISIIGTGGQCIMVPPAKESGKQPYILYNIGGVAANTLVTVIASAISFVTYDIQYLQLFLGLFILSGTMIAATNGIPLPCSGNDASNLLEIGSSPAAKEAFFIMLWGNELLKNGTRVKDFPEEWFSMPSEQELKNSICSTRAVYICDRLMDEHRFSEAQKLIDTLTCSDNNINHVQMEMLRLNALFCEIVGGMDSGKISSYLDRDMQKYIKGMTSYPSVIRTLYVYELLFAHNSVKADEQYKKFMEVEKTFPYPVEIEAERELIDIAKKLAGVK